MRRFSSQVNLSILPADFTDDQAPEWGFHVKAASGSSLDPAAVQIVDKGTGAAVTPLYSANNARTGVTDSIVLATLSISHQYFVSILGENNTQGDYSLEVFLTEATTVSSNTGTFQFPDVMLAAGGNPFTVQATAAAGNTSGTPADPNQASANPGQNITLEGTGLSTNTDVLLQYIDIKWEPPDGAAQPGFGQHRWHTSRSQTIIAAITSNTSRVHETTQLLIEVATPDGAASGLLHDSAVRCERLHSIPQADVRRVIGKLSDVLMPQIDDCLKAALGLP